MDDNNGTTVADLRQDEPLRYRLKVLLYDLSNITKDPSCEQRLSSTVNELYISEPYFSESEALQVRSAMTNLGLDDSDQPLTVKEALHKSLEDFFDKRRAGGDARPCSPHDMVPIYATVFEVDKAELKDERFLSRLKRLGLELQSKPEGAPS